MVLPGTGEAADSGGRDRRPFRSGVLAKAPPAAINAMLAGVGRLRLVSVTSPRPDLVVFVMSVRGAQRFRVELPVDAHGQITNIQAKELAPTAPPASMIPALEPGWVAAPVTFGAGGVTIHGTYTHPGGAAAGTVPAAVLLGGSGPATDRNDNAAPKARRLPGVRPTGEAARPSRPPPWWAAA